MPGNRFYAARITGTRLCVLHRRCGYGSPNERTHKASRSFPTERTASERIADSYLRMATGEMSARELNDRLHTSPLRVRYPETWRMARFFRAALHAVRDAVD